MQVQRQGQNFTGFNYWLEMDAKNVPKTGVEMKMKN